MNANNPPTFGGDDVAFAYAWAPAASTPTPLARDLFAETGVKFIDQLPTNRCGGIAAEISPWMFAVLHGVDPGDLDDLFSYEGAMTVDRGQWWSRQDLGLAAIRSAAQTLYFRGIAKRGLSGIGISPPNPWTGEPGYVGEPSPESIADAATRKVGAFDHALTNDSVGMACVAIANRCPVMLALRVDNRFFNVQGPPEDHPAQFQTGTAVDFKKHFVVAGAFDVARQTIDVTSNMGGAPVVRLPFGYFGSNLIDAYVIREFMGLKSEISPFNICPPANGRSAEVMRNLRYYMHNVIREDYAIGGRVIPQEEKGPLIREDMRVHSVTDLDLAHAALPWYLKDELGVARPDPLAAALAAVRARIGVA
ncbi:MAG: hypothetical protein HYX47_10160 [Burkholderiales bacterium]|nr:hypothetical protein [Burkholderiales bacterium]